ncbi:Caudovirus, tape measure, N-terminal [uncultured Caudovirales phage]|uniref:Caudovirus, tape measure, N-terminal n=1 Tax=uncultured Caudovirales phage TaxID=2100421 RepID=A0A6J5RJX3_9CAUD|nr:Caudovirus, tape measure, N-terminal [uncultured Caudovirales phage]
MAIVRELITRFGFNVDQSGMNRVEGSINRLSGMLSGLAAFASLRALAKVADSMQSLDARIGMLPQTIGDVGAAFNEVGKHALATRTPLAAYGTLYTRIGNAAKEYITDQKDLLQVTDTIANSLVVGGATTQEASSAMLQFAQALGAGSLQGEEFRAMAESTPQYMDQLAIAMGFPRDQLKKMASDGKLTARLVIEATKKMSDYFERRAKQMPMTIGQAYSDIGTRFSMMVQNMNRESQVVTKIAEFMISGFGRIENGAKKFIDFVGGSTNALKTFGIALAAVLGPWALAGLVAALGAIFSVAGLVVGGLILLGLAIDDLIVWANGGESAFGDFLNSIKTDPITGLLMSILAFVATLKLFNSGILITIGRLGMLAAAAIASGIKIGAAFLIAMGPIGLLIAAIAAIGTAIYLIGTNWDSITNWMGDKVTWLIDKLKSLGQYLPDFSGGNISVNSATISPASMAGANGGVKNVTSNQIVNLTVPPGTPESQQAFLIGAAGVFKGESPEKKMARDMSGGGW